MLLNGWKEIASHLRCSVRTTQRWEMLGLPIHRPKLNVGPVFAFSEDVDEWLKQTPQRILIEYAPKTEHEFASFRYKVLVVDDDELICEVYAELLSKVGYEVRTARNGFEALALMREGGVPDLLVSDLNMPEMSGFELLSVVRRRFPGVAVIAISGAYTPVNHPALLADFFVEKGGSGINLLTNAASELLSRSPLRAQPAKMEGAVAWIPRSTNGYVVVTCTDCLRSFSVPSSEANSSQPEIRASCVHCGVTVAFRIDPTSQTERAGGNHKKVG